MAQQNTGAFGHANVTPISPESEVKETKTEDDDFPQSLEEALLGE